MKRCFVYLVLCAALLAASNYTVRSAEQKPAAGSEPASREESVLVTVTASVEAIDYTNREVTLKGPLGNIRIFKVSDAVERFNEIKPGDQVVIRVTEAIALAVVKP